MNKIRKEYLVETFSTNGYKSYKFTNLKDAKKKKTELKRSGIGSNIIYAEFKNDELIRDYVIV